MLRRFFGLLAGGRRPEGGERAERGALTALGLFSVSLMLGWGVLFAYSAAATLVVYLVAASRAT